MRRRDHWRPGIVAAALAAAAFAAGGCAVDGLGFVADDRVEITSPADREEITLPVTIDWTARGVETGRAGQEFALLIDRAPPPPGHAIDWLFRDDDGCAVAPGCPNEEYLAARGVFVTTETSLTIERVPTLAAPGRHDFHEVTIVLLDPSGERAGESAWSVEFELVGEV